IGRSCHIHSSLVDGSNGTSVFVNGHEETDAFRHFLGGVRNRIRELALLIAPSVNSYKRYAAESWAPTSISWGRDNRTCGFRVVGHGQSRRVECRIPGADVNPYLGLAALLAAGLDGIENAIDPGPELKGNAYAAGEAEPFPSSLPEVVGVDRAYGTGVLVFGRDPPPDSDQQSDDQDERRVVERFEFEVAFPRHTRRHNRDVEGVDDEHDERDRAGVDPLVARTQGP